jgi:biofilm protein TabA
MVFDDLIEANRYGVLGRRLARGLAFVASSDLTTLAEGRLDLEGNDLFVSVSQYDTKLEPQGIWEAHRRYVDIQCLASGRERIGRVSLGAVPCGSYDAEKDLLLASAPGTAIASGDFVTLTPGRFVVLFPHDAHMSGIAAGGRPEPVKKIVVKVRVDD